MDRKFIDEYESGGEMLAQAIEGLTPEDLLAPPPRDAAIGLWSIQQIVIHLMDSDLIWTSRMKSIIAEDHPRIVGYDETRFAANLFYDLQDPHRAVRIFDLNRKQFAKVLRKLPDSGFTRTATHDERGDITLDWSVHAMVEHLAHHIKFIRLKRERLGKPMN
jgi:uncharacterized damage-inducible protein DinB